MRGALLLMILLISAAPAIADELYGMGGMMRSRNLDADDSSYSWQLEYRQPLGEHLAVSLSYLNEGHVPAHHRDGNALQLWATGELIARRLSLSAGFGPYYYFDTTLPAANGSYTNHHGLGGIASLALIIETETPWLFQLRTNWVNTFGQMDTVSALAGIGYRLDVSGPPKSDHDQAESDVAENEITLFAGRTITNSFESEHSTSLCLEYRRGLLKYLDWTASWIYEGDTRLIRRDGVASQFWAVKDFKQDRIALGFGVGTYFSIDRQAGSSLNGDRLVSMIATMTGSYRLDPSWSLRTSWNRIVTNYDRDTDVIMGGVGYRF
ncbi:MAG: hypothetical protein A2X82_03135 [Geobacteraceae bacterium GWC2_55_20]|nr:MAG: hypothetical protein A2X82_03135 [Geobacteraceae bacterium GWC2_55_20]OGU24733.1 MAG: hypothetical protein A2X85_14030 [Geobacteraceae bacterium GWF2_54_21]